MILFPAIDLKSGMVVRLNQGKFDAVTAYQNDPIAVARHWQQAGAAWLHVVDLDGAQTGNIKNFEIIASIARAVSIPIQVGGGIRNNLDIERLLESGVKRVVLGTRAVEDKNALKDIVKNFAGQVAVSIDCLDGYITQRGWTVTSPILGVDFARELEEFGVKTLIFTDIKRDGMLTGPNIPAIETILEAVHIDVIASGGISNLNDIAALCALSPKRPKGVIIGKALYENKFELPEALKICSAKE